MERPMLEVGTEAETKERIICLEQKIVTIERRIGQISAWCNTLQGHIWDVEEGLKSLHITLEFRLPVLPPADDLDIDSDRS
jgi:hypothetical protein